MRLKLTLKPMRRNIAIPLNYNYFLSSAIYQWIEQSSPTYSTFLHDRGYSIPGTIKRFKHFCFSMLLIPKRKLLNSYIQIFSQNLEWLISMPVEETLQHLVVGIFEKQELFIANSENRFLIEQVETLPEPMWSRVMKFRLLSALTTSIPERKNGKTIPHYLRPNDEQLKSVLQANILNKYISLYGNKPVDQTFICTLDKEFIASRGGNDKISKLITIREGHEEETRVRGFMCPLSIEGNPNLIKLAYESGLGEKGSLGFGMIEAVHSESAEGG